MLYRDILRHPSIQRAEDILEHVPRLQSWNPVIYHRALDQLIADGRIAESPEGRLVVNPLVQPPGGDDE